MGNPSPPKEIDFLFRKVLEWSVARGREALINPQGRGRKIIGGGT